MRARVFERQNERDLIQDARARDGRYVVCAMYSQEASSGIHHSELLEEKSDCLSKLLVKGIPDAQMASERGRRRRVAWTGLLWSALEIVPERL